MELLDGKTLYDEVFWVFPPRHLLAAWIGYALDPPGIVLARIIYAAFNVAASLSLLFLARRLMPPEFALLGALLVAVAAPISHFYHLLFGYRYLAWSIAVLLFFDLRLRRDESRWLFLAGVFAGISLFFRLTPAFAVSAAVAVGIVAASRSWRRWLRDGLWYGAGLLLVWIPVLTWIHGTVGFETFWVETVVRPVEMTALQSKPIPPIELPDLGRTTLQFFTTAIGFRLYPLLYFAFLLALFAKWARSVAMRRPYEHVLLLTFVVFGAVYFMRGMGRSDMPHLDSAIPPVAVLLAYCASLSTRPSVFRAESGEKRSASLRWALCVGVFGVWVFLNGSDRFLDRDAVMGDTALRNVSEEIKVESGSGASIVDGLVPVIQEYATPEDTILVLAHVPLIHVLSERHSPGYFDVIMHGTFRNPEEEQHFVERLAAGPPAVVIWPRQHFDNMPSRSLAHTAPILSRWVFEHYRPAGDSRIYQIMVPRSGE
jgi:hypothetical protein